MLGCVYFSCLRVRCGTSWPSSTRSPPPPSHCRTSNCWYDISLVTLSQFHAQSLRTAETYNFIFNAIVTVLQAFAPSFCCPAFPDHQSRQSKTPHSIPKPAATAQVRKTIKSDLSDLVGIDRAVEMQQPSPLHQRPLQVCVVFRFRWRQERGQSIL